MGLGSRYNLRSMNTNNQTNQRSNEQLSETSEQQQHEELNASGSNNSNNSQQQQVMTPTTNVSLTIQELTLTISKIVAEQIAATMSTYATPERNFEDRLRRASQQEETASETENNSSNRNEIARLLRETIPVFAGKTSPILIEGLFTKLEAYFKTFDKLTESEKLMISSSKLSNTAEIWWREQLRTKSRATESYNNFKEELRACFILPEQQTRVYYKLESLVQGTKSISEYAASFQILCDQLIDLKESNAIRYFLKGLNPSISKLVRTNSNNTTSLKNVLQAALSQEENLYLSQPRVGAKENSQTQANLATATRGKPKTKVNWKEHKCALCKQVGHSERYCSRTTEFIQNNAENANFIQTNFEN